MYLYLHCISDDRIYSRVGTTLESKFANFKVELYVCTSYRVFLMDMVDLIENSTVSLPLVYVTFLHHFYAGIFVSSSSKNISKIIKKRSHSRS